MKIRCAVGTVRVAGPLSGEESMPPPTTPIDVPIDMTGAMTGSATAVAPLTASA